MMWPAGGLIVPVAIGAAFVLLVRHWRSGALAALVALSLALTAGLVSFGISIPLLDPDPVPTALGLMTFDGTAPSMAMAAGVMVLCLSGMAAALMPATLFRRWTVLMASAFVLLAIGSTVSASVLGLVAWPGVRMDGSFARIGPAGAMPVLFLVVVVPAAIGIPWSMQRGIATFAGELASIQRRYLLIISAYLVFLHLAISALVGWYALVVTESGREIRFLPALALLLALAVVEPLLLSSLWRNFTQPGLAVLEGLQREGSVADRPERLPRFWRPALDRIAALERAQAMFRAFFDNSPVMMFVHDRDDRLQMVNRAAAAVFSRTPEEIVGDHMDEFRDPALRDELARRGREIMATGIAQTMEIPVPSAEGPRHGLVSAFPIPDADGSINLLGGMTVDLTPVVRAEGERDELRRLFDAFMRETPVTMYLKRATGEMVFVSGNITEQFGATNADIIGRQEAELIPLFTDWGEAAIQALHQLDEAVLTTREAVAVEGLHPGTGRFEMIRRFPIFDDAGEITHIGGVQLDVDDFIRARDEADRAKDALYQSEKLAALGQLLAGVSHELNNPLTVVVGRSAILEEKLSETPHAGAISSLREAADRCNRIVKTFLAMARQSGPSRSAVQVNDVVDAALEMTAYGLRSEGIEVVTDLDPGIPLIEADEDQIVQVITNLLLNAQQAMMDHPGMRRITIRSRFDRGAGEVTLEVADTGPGIPDEIAGRIFEPFFTTKDVGAGTGMGLAISRGMIEAQGGTLVQAPGPGGGAAFRIVLPVSEADGPEAPPDELPAMPMASRGRVLIVDDEPSVRALLVECLAPLELACGEAADGLQALELASGGGFDLVFCDIRMPRMDGVAFYRALSEADAALAERTIFMSGDVLNRDAPRIAAIAHRPIIDKPFNPRDVREAALALLGTGDRS